MDSAGATKGWAVTEGDMREVLQDWERNLMAAIAEYRRDVGVVVERLELHYKAILEAIQATEAGLHREFDALKLDARGKAERPEMHQVEKRLEHRVGVSARTE